ncbi:Pal1 cell morphology protein-domain-containing protein [Biscogniauxia marginata]|nr:Pal1 cell morphology protein-domain-containing protein [Biscogniauxia marginata]
MSGAQSVDLLGLSDNDNNGRSPGLTLNLSSNNPFRNRAASPSSFSPPPRSPFDDPPPRPTSNNPFLDPSNDNLSRSLTLTLPDKMASPKDKKTPTAEDLFESLTIEDKKTTPRSGGGRQSVSRPSGGPPRGENVPPRGRGLGSSSHRPTRSQEEALRARKAPPGSGEKLIPISSPPRQTERRPRRNSDSSMLEKPLTDEEKKMREIRRKERERRHREGKDKDKRTGRKLDIIDQLDATSIYGTGLFHHDGPFDACNPHRNRKGSRRAPMQAFAKDSANNSLGGAGPLNDRPDHKLFMGQEPHDASLMYAGAAREKESARNEMTLFDPKQRGEYEHGEETLGLGSSTFLEGAPAARAAIQRNESETAQEFESGLGRKKSVVQRFRSMKRGPRDYESGRVTSPPEPYYSPRPDLPSGNSNGNGERNPFFSEFDRTEDRITVKRKDSNTMSPTSPPGPSGLERRATTDTNAALASDGGFLSRVKSLKGGRRQRPEPPSKEGVAAVPGTSM